MSLKTVTVRTDSPQQFIDITAMVRMVLRESGVASGVCHVYVPHTTAAVTINENADPDVRRDLLDILDKVAPPSGTYHHSEGNSHAHTKATLVGSSVTVFVEAGQLVLGTWQSIFFCEFDGPRTRNIIIRVTS